MAKITVTLVESTTKEIEVSNVVYRALVLHGDKVLAYKADCEKDLMISVGCVSASINKHSYHESILFGADTFDIEPQEFYEAYAKAVGQLDAIIGIERNTLNCTCND